LFPLLKMEVMEDTRSWAEFWTLKKRMSRKEGRWEEVIRTLCRASCHVSFVIHSISDLSHSNINVHYVHKIRGHPRLLSSIATSNNFEFKKTRVLSASKQRRENRNSGGPRILIFIILASKMRHYVTTING
jgi:hypothetical protein